MTRRPKSQDRSVLITGCSSGIGLASAKMLKARGWHVLATARRNDDLDMLAGLGVTPVRLELTDPESVAACAQQALELTDGNLFGLFNNAAYGQPGAVEDLSVAVLKAQFEVNFFSWHDLTCRLIPAMRRNGRGRIVQCSSVLGLISPPWRGAYNASKFALEALTDAMRYELEGSGIDVSLIEPGPIETSFLARTIREARENIDLEGSVHARTYRQRLAGMERGGRTRFKLPADTVAEKLVHALESPRPRVRYYVTVPTYLAAVGRRVLPQGLADQMIRGT